MIRMVFEVLLYQGKFCWWNMESWFKIDYDITLAIECMLDIPNDTKGRTLKKKMWTELQIKIFKDNKKSIKSILLVLPNDLLSKIGEYKNIKNL